MTPFARALSLWAKPTRSKRPARQSVRPMLTCLEAREVPATFTLKDVPGTSVWADPASWLVDGRPAGRAPGPEDLVLVAEGEHSIDLGNTEVVVRTFTTAAAGFSRPEPKNLSLLNGTLRARDRVSFAGEGPDARLKLTLGAGVVVGDGASAGPGSVASGGSLSFRHVDWAGSDVRSTAGYVSADHSTLPIVSLAGGGFGMRGGDVAGVEATGAGVVVTIEGGTVSLLTVGGGAVANLDGTAVGRITVGDKPGPGPDVTLRNGSAADVLVGANCDFNMEGVVTLRDLTIEPGGMARTDADNILDPVDALTVRRVVNRGTFRSNSAHFFRDPTARPHLTADSVLNEGYMAFPSFAVVGDVVNNGVLELAAAWRPDDPGQASGYVGVYAAGSFTNAASGEVIVVGGNLPEGSAQHRPVFAVTGTARLNGVFRQDGLYLPREPRGANNEFGSPQAVPLMSYATLDGRFREVTGTPARAPSDSGFVGLDYDDDRLSLSLIPFPLRPDQVEFDLTRGNGDGPAGLVVVFGGAGGYPDLRTAKLVARPGWDVLTIDFQRFSRVTLNPINQSERLGYAANVYDLGASLGFWLRDLQVVSGRPGAVGQQRLNYTSVHAIGWSMGAWGADGFLDAFALDRPELATHLTVTDVYDPSSFPRLVQSYLPGRGRTVDEEMGDSADYGEHFFHTGDDFLPTNTRFPRLMNFDITLLDRDGLAESLSEGKISSGPVRFHEFPMYWYAGTAGSGSADVLALANRAASARAESVFGPVSVWGFRRTAEVTGSMPRYFQEVVPGVEFVPGGELLLVPPEFGPRPPDDGDPPIQEPPVVPTPTPDPRPTDPPTHRLPVLPPVAAARTFTLGGGPGSAGTIRSFAPDGRERAAVPAFPFATPGGIRVAEADVTGDGVADILAGTGPGIPAQVRLFDGKTLHELFVLDPFEAAFTGGVFVALGDVDGDGRADLVLTPDEGGGPRVRVFSGNGFGQLADFFGIDDPNFRGGARAAVGDVDGDGYGDLIVAAGFGGGPRVAGFSGRALPTGELVRVFGDFLAFEDTLRNGVYVAAGDLDGDGFADVVAGAGPGGGPRVLAMSGQALLRNEYQVRADFLAGDPLARSGVRAAVKNLDGDDKADLLAGAGARVAAYAGSTLGAGVPPELFALDAADGVFVG